MFLPLGADNPSYAIASARQCKCSRFSLTLYRKQERSLFTAALEQTSDWLCSSCRFATFRAHHCPLLIDRSHAAIGPGIEDQSDWSQIGGGGEKGEGERGNRHIIVGRPPIAPLPSPSRPRRWSNSDHAGASKRYVLERNLRSRPGNCISRPGNVISPGINIPKVHKQIKNKKCQLSSEHYLMG